MTGRKSVDFGAFEYWKKRPANSALASHDVPKPPRKIPKYPHRLVDPNLSESVRASMVIHEYLTNEYGRLVEIGVSSEELAEFENAAGEVATFMQEFEGLPESHFEPPPEPPLPNKQDIILKEKEAELERSIVLYQQKIQFWEDKLSQSNRLLFPSNDPPDESTDAIEEEISQLRKEAKETLITYTLQTDSLERKLNQMMCVNDAVNSSVQKMASQLIASHHKSMASPRI